MMQLQNSCEGEHLYVLDFAVIGFARDFFLIRLREMQTLFTQNEGLLETCLAMDLVTKY